MCQHKKRELQSTHSENIRIVLEPSFYCALDKNCGHHEFYERRFPFLLHKTLKYWISNGLPRKVQKWDRERSFGLWLMSVLYRIFRQFCIKSQLVSTSSGGEELFWNPSWTFSPLLLPSKTFKNGRLKLWQRLQKMELEAPSAILKVASRESVGSSFINAVLT